MEEAAGILVVDDDRGMRTTLVATLEDYGYRLNACESGQEALATIQQSPPLTSCSPTSDSPIWTVSTSSRLSRL